MSRELVLGSGLGSSSDNYTVTIYATPVGAASVTVADVGGYYNSSNVEAVLAELAAGGDGATWLSGAGAPSNALGSNRDFYLDTTNHAYYGPKTYGAWGSAHTLVGPQGIQGLQGIQGIQGPIGIAATVAAGSVTTGAPGSSAVVTNSGTTSAAVFNFTIPRGDTGATGPVGPVGSANYILLNQFFV